MSLTNTTPGNRMLLSMCCLGSESALQEEGRQAHDKQYQFKIFNCKLYMCNYENHRVGALNSFGCYGDGDSLTS